MSPRMEWLSAISSIYRVTIYFLGMESVSDKPVCVCVCVRVCGNLQNTVR